MKSNLSILKLEHRGYYYQSLIEYLIQHFRMQGHILDVGCGTGSITRLLSKSLGTAGKLDGLDISSEYIEYARQHGNSESYIVGDCYALPFPDNEYDGCFAMNLLETLDRPVDSLKEMLRVVKNGGFICIIDIDYNKIHTIPPIKHLKKLNRINAIIKKQNGQDAYVGSKLSTYCHEAGLTQCTKFTYKINNLVSPGFERSLFQFYDDDKQYLLSNRLFSKDEYEEMIDSYRRYVNQILYEIEYDCIFAVIHKE